ANVEVQSFLSEPHPTNVLDCDNLVRSLDAKCYAIEKLSAAFKNLTTDPQFSVLASTRQLNSLSQPELSRDRGIMSSSDVLKFGPMLQNILMAGSITKAVQMLGALLSLQQLKLFSISSSSSSSSSQDDQVFSISSSSSSQDDQVFSISSSSSSQDDQVFSISSSSSSQDDQVFSISSSSSSQDDQVFSISSSSKVTKLPVPSSPTSSASLTLTKDKEAKDRIFVRQEKTPQQPNATTVTTTQIKENDSQIRQKTPGATNLGKLLPGFTNPANQKTALAPPPLDPGSDIGVQHQKQTSSQLMQFLRTNHRNEPFMEFAAFFQKASYQYTSSGFTAPATTSDPLMETKNAQETKNVLETNNVSVLKKELSSELTDNQLNQHAPVFTVKRVESGGCLIFSCIIATKTELWDIGDVFTEVTRSGPSSDVITTSENKMSAASLHCQSVEISNVTLHPPAQSIHSLQNREVQEDVNNISLTPELQSFQNCCSFIAPGNQGLSIPGFQIRKFEEMAVVVSHVVHPGNFYIQQADTTLQLEGLNTDRLKGSSSLAELKCIPDIGTYVMAWFPQLERWCRAQVAKICGMSGDNNELEVEVRRLDYGDTSCLSLWNIKELSAEMTSLPLQAIQVSLANVRPVDGCGWTQQSVSWFRDMVDNRTLYARLYPQGDGDNTTVELFIEKGKLGAMRRGASLSLRLAQNGHAEHDKLRNLGIKRGSVQERTKKRESAWNKYLISCLNKK
ncbi:putative GPI-anchored protein pfl2, partial [Coregonus clupeaformis]|uniref:putative GPI-anchored protein pfl2 n=1 Tax=Coregonus clupeaformis TaxID=59861 RepID=UPI001E1C827C